MNTRPKNIPGLIGSNEGALIKGFLLKKGRKNVVVIEANIRTKDQRHSVWMIIIVAKGRKDKPFVLSKHSFKPILLQTMATIDKAEIGKDLFKGISEIVIDERDRLCRRCGQEASVSLERPRILTTRILHKEGSNGGNTYAISFAP